MEGTITIGDTLTMEGTITIGGTITIRGTITIGGTGTMTRLLVALYLTSESIHAPYDLLSRMASKWIKIRNRGRAVEASFCGLKYIVIISRLGKNYWGCKYII
jgi:hypothetical protein